MITGKAGNGLPLTFKKGGYMFIFNSKTGVNQVKINSDSRPFKVLESTIWSSDKRSLCITSRWNCSVHGVHFIVEERVICNMPDFEFKFTMKVEVKFYIDSKEISTVTAYQLGILDK